MVMLGVGGEDPLVDLVDHSGLGIVVTLHIGEATLSRTFVLAVRGPVLRMALQPVPEGTRPSRLDRVTGGDVHVAPRIGGLEQPVFLPSGSRMASVNPTASKAVR
jgi:hypothetical protein